MKKKQILIVDDDRRIRIALRDLLMASGYDVLEASDGSKGLEVFYDHTNTIDLILLDIMMPKESGMTVMEEIRSLSKVPIILLTARVGERDHVAGLKLGADDYMTKPFSTSILLARIQAVLRRGQTDVITIGDIRLDSSKHTIYLKENILSLTQKEYDLLSYFISHINSALSREQLLLAVWNARYQGDGRTVDTHVKQLRAKLKTSDVYIETVFGIGYRLRGIDV